MRTPLFEDTSCIRYSGFLFLVYLPYLLLYPLAGDGVWVWVWEFVDLTVRFALYYFKGFVFLGLVGDEHIYLLQTRLPSVNYRFRICTCIHHLTTCVTLLYSCLVRTAFGFLGHIQEHIGVRNNVTP